MYYILKNTSSFRAYVFLHWCKIALEDIFFLVIKFWKQHMQFFSLQKIIKKNKTRRYPIVYYHGIWTLYRLNIDFKGRIWWSENYWVVQMNKTAIEIAFVRWDVSQGFLLLLTSTFWRLFQGLRAKKNPIQWKLV